jgi:hypothetical protein
MGDKSLTTTQPTDGLPALDGTLSRRDFLKTGAAVLGSAAFLGTLPHVEEVLNQAASNTPAYPMSQAQNIIFWSMLAVQYSMHD